MWLAIFSNQTFIICRNCLDFARVLSDFVQNMNDGEGDYEGEGEGEYDVEEAHPHSEGDINNYQNEDNSEGEGEDLDPDQDHDDRYKYMLMAMANQLLGTYPINLSSYSWETRKAATWGCNQVKSHRKSQPW